MSAIKTHYKKYRAKKTCTGWFKQDDIYISDYQKGNMLGFETKQFKHKSEYGVFYEFGKEYYQFDIKDFEEIPLNITLGEYIERSKFNV